MATGLAGAGLAHVLQKANDDGVQRCKLGQQLLRLLFGWRNEIPRVAELNGVGR
jgi:hypothetical protein